MITQISQLKERYAGEWLCIRVTKEENWEPVEGELIAHSRYADDVHRVIQQTPDLKEFYLVYAGPEIPPDYEVML